MKHIILAAIMIASTTSSSLADDRYVIVERDGGIIRVDTETGRISFCHQDDGKPVCKVAAEERKAWMAEVEDLEKRVSELEKKTPPDSGALSKSKEDELDETMRVAEAMLRRFFGIIKTIKGDLEAN